MKKRKQEEENEKKWEIYQRNKRDEYNKVMDDKKLQNERIRKKKIADELKRQMKENEDLRKKEMIENDDSIYTTEALKKSNEIILAYGKQVLEESTGIRPVFPIIKVIEQFKKENRLVPAKKYYRNENSLKNCNCLTNNVELKITSQN
ncbi:uncharacterized protein LOC123270840 [Cotesia glomerata]|nr:uncharacterized protein LOC123270840 [Cotesia glomerata]